MHVSVYLQASNDLFFLKARAAIQCGLSGPSVPYLVEMGVVVVHGLAPIPHRALVEKIAHNWDLRERLRNAV